MKKKFISQNPFDGKILKEYEATSDIEIQKHLDTTTTIFQNWKSLSISKRSDLFLKLGTVIKENKNELAKLITLEMGKLISESEAEVLKCAATCDYYAQQAESFLKNNIIKTDAQKSYTSLQPLGVVLGIMPWNFPLWQALRFAIPTLISGNIIILKHASNVSGCALAIEDLFIKAGFPPGVFKTFLIKSTEVEKLIASPQVKAVSLTGSTQAGQSVGKACGYHLKKSVLELGGSDPYIILDDADLERAADVCAKARMNNAGQTCIAAKRFIVTEKIYADFLNLFKQKLSGYKFGNPLDPNTNLAPLSRFDLREELQVQVTKALQNGAKLNCGGIILEDSGAFYPPTILENILPKNPAFNEEFFGPVALFFKVKNETEAIQIANATEFGLGSAIFSRNIEHAEELAEKSIEAGSCFINTQVRTDPRLPFGGTKASGYGRELSNLALYEFTNVKTIYVG